MAAEGFWSGMDEFRADVRASRKYTPWFELAHELDALAAGALARHDTDSGDPQDFSLSLITARACQAFNAAIVLAERGMIADARAVTRSAAEAAIAAIAVSKDAAFVRRFVTAHNYQRAADIRSFLGEPEFRNTLAPDDLRKLQDELAELIAQRATPGPETRPISWQAVAKQHCPSLYGALYRPLSNDGTHITATALERHIEADGDQIAAIVVGPTTRGLSETLRYACLALSWAMEAFFAHHGMTSEAQALKSLGERMDTLPDEDERADR